MMLCIQEDRLANSGCSLIIIIYNNNIRQVPGIATQRVSVVDSDPLATVLLPFQVMINKVYNPGIVGGGSGGVILVVTRKDCRGMGV